MTHQTRSFAIDSGIRVAQGLGLGHAAVARELIRVRRLLAAAQAEAEAARAETAVLAREAASANRRADRAEADLRRFVVAVRDGRVVTRA